MKPQVPSLRFHRLRCESDGRGAVAGFGVAGWVKMIECKDDHPGKKLWRGEVSHDLFFFSLHCSTPNLF